MELWWRYLVIVVIGYLMGNFFSARIIAKIKKTDKIAGSGNPGTMNMLRTHGFGLGFVTLILDACKGVIPALVGFYLLNDPNNWANIGDPVTDANMYSYIGLYVGGLSALIGGIFPVFYKFKGGKGAATIYGMFIVADWKVALIIFGVGLLWLFLADYGSLASFTMVTVCTVVNGIKMQGYLVISLLLFLIFAIMFFGFRNNIFRLLVGKENKANFKLSLEKLREKKHRKMEQKARKMGDLG